MKSLYILITILLCSGSVFSQEQIQQILQEKNKKNDSLVKIDFLGYKYKYLDENFKINIPKDIYEKTFTDYKFIPGRIKNYRDSLGVVLIAEFKDNDAARIAGLRINYTWKRVGYHTWMSENEILALAKKLNIKMPYRLQELFLNNDPKVKSEIQNLRDKLFLELKKEELKTMPTQELLRYGFKYNPELVELRKKGHNHDSPQQNK
ncbi:hypothetical protein ACFFLS_21950 [Flavobacterium procerum]|uniref:DUF4252 domain-containing protein n=1 Tax=Flavobacterium procerum TaxID=1455569 RepID=A0ABV6BWA9_9FLAO